MFTLTQSISISSTDMKKVPIVSRGVTSLIKEGVEIDSNSPSYHYTKLSELKINMLADATKDASTRAEQIVNNAHLPALLPDEHCKSSVQRGPHESQAAPAVVPFACILLAEHRLLCSIALLPMKTTR